MNREYRSSMDWWIVSLWSALMLICLGGGLHLLQNKGDYLAGIGGIAVAVGMMVLSIPTRYKLNEQNLVVRSGLFRWKIPLDSIVSAQFSTNLLSAPAWSLKRIRVDFMRKSGRKSFVLISPNDRESFLRDLAESCPDLESFGVQMVKRRSKAMEVEGGGI